MSCLKWIEIQMSDQIEVREKAQVSSEISFGKFLARFCSALAVVGFLTFPAQAQTPWQAGDAALPKPVDPSANLAPEGGCKPEIDKKFTTQQVGEHLYEHGGFISGGKQCYAVKIYTPTKELVADLLVAGIHSDGDGETAEAPQRMNELIERITAQIAFKNTKVAISNIAREGYVLNGIGQSSGDKIYYGNRSYLFRPVQHMMMASDNLALALRAKKIMGVGVSGGAAYWAIGATMDRQVPLAEAAIISCPCDIPAWESWKRWAPSGSISPAAIAASTNKATKVIVISGKKDGHTLPEFSDTYAKNLQQAGVAVENIRVPGDHVTARFSPETIGRLTRSIEELSK